MNDAKTSGARTYSASCFCGAVEFSVHGAPAAMGYCHCEDCRRWAAAPLSAFTMWAPDAITVTRGADEIGAFAKTPASVRKWCRRCGGHLFTEHPSMGLVDVGAALVPELAFRPALHTFYGETALPLRDGLPKMKDVPAPAGGSGTLLPE